MLIIIQESIKNRTNLVYQKSNEVHWVVLRIKHICNTVSNKSLISGLFKISKVNTPKQGVVTQFPF